MISKTEFSRDDANQLRESLAKMDFRLDGASNTDSELARSYRDHYGLNFGVNDNVTHHILGLFNSGPYQIVCQYFAVTPSEQKGTAFLIHGYFDHCGIYGHLIEHCVRQGFAVVIFDLPGHGLSSGSIASIGSFREYSKAFLDCLAVANKQEVNQPWIAIGQSAGAAILIDSILDAGLAEKYSFQRYILLGPLLRPRRWFKSSLLFSITRWFVASSPRKFSENSHDQEFLRFLRQNDALQSNFLSRDWVLAMIDYQKRFKKSDVSDQAVHIIQGGGDGTVDWEHNLPKLHEKFPAAKSYIVSDARHQLINESVGFRDKIFSLINQILSDL